MDGDINKVACIMAAAAAAADGVQVAQEKCRGFRKSGFREVLFGKKKIRVK